MSSRDEEKRLLDEEIEKAKQNVSDLASELYGDHEDFDDPHEDQDPQYLLNKNQRIVDSLIKKRKKIDFEEENEKKHNIFKEFVKNGSIHSDKESSKDLLSRTNQAEMVSRLIANKESQPPLTIGVYGPWGRGKSTFVKLLEEQLNVINKEIKEDVNKEKQYSISHIIHFNPTEYDNQNTIWYAMLRALYLKYDSDKGFNGRLAYAFRRLSSSYNRNKIPYIINAILMLLIGILITFYFISIDNSLIFFDNNNILLGLVTVGVTLGALLKLSIPIIKKFQFVFKPISSRVIQHILIPDYGSKLGTREEVKRALEELINVWLDKDQKIVLLVDELDRCSEKTIVEFFSALQLFLSFESIVNVISMNEETVALALAENQKFQIPDNLSRQEKIKFGMDYVAKYITMSFTIPLEKSYSEFLKALLNKQTKYFSEEEKKIIIKMISNMASKKEITPREVKKIINMLILLKETVVDRSSDFKFNLSYTEFIKWFLVDYFNRKGAKAFIKKLSLVRIFQEHQYNFFHESYAALKPSHDDPDKNEKTIIYLTEHLKDVRVYSIRIAHEILEMSYTR